MCTFNIVRLGLARALGSIKKGPRFERDYSLLSQRELLNLHSQMVAKLKGEPYGIYDMFAIFVGPTLARTVMGKHRIRFRAIPPAIISAASKRRRDEEDNSDDADVSLRGSKTNSRQTRG